MVCVDIRAYIWLVHWFINQSSLLNDLIKFSLGKSLSHA